MIMNTYPSSKINQIEDCFVGESIYKTIQNLTFFLYREPDNYPGFHDEINEIEDDYNRMLGFFQKGALDPDRDKIFQRYSASLLKITRNLEVNYLVKKNAVYAAAYRRTRNFNPSVIAVKLAEFKDKLEMLDELSEPDITAYQEEKRKLYKEKAEYDNLLFSYILISPQWSEHEDVFFSELISFGKIEKNTAALLVSAIMIACMNVYDAHKFKSLVRIYKEATDVNVKERALVGWVFSMVRTDKQFETDERKSVIADLCKSTPDALKELVELQKQIYFNIHSPEETARLQKDLNELVSDRDVVSEFAKDDMEDSSLKDILGTDNEKVEKIEKYANKLRGLEESGVDVNFGGFSKMKTFAFFHTFSNWFVPFYINHPALNAMMEEMAGCEKNIQIFVDRGCFCDSDKYSLAFAIEMTVKDLPLIKKVVASSSPLPIDNEIKVQKADPTMVRRLYLQSLFRFFKLCKMTTNLFDPFDAELSSMALFSSFSEFREDAFEPLKLPVCYFFVKQKSYDRLAVVLRNCHLKPDFNYYMLNALASFHFYEDYDDTLDSLTSALLITPNSYFALKLLMRCYIKMQHYENAIDVCRRLIGFDKDTDDIKNKLAFCLLKNGDIAEGVQLLFELDYKFPNRVDIQRQLAWGLEHRGQLDKALTYFNKYIGKVSEKWLSDNSEDLYNIGVTYLCLHDMENAAKYFAKYKKYSFSQGEIILIGRDDKALLDKYNITNVDVRLVNDLTHLVDSDSL